MSISPGVVVFSSEYPPYLLGGLGTHVQHMTAALARSWRVDVVVPDLGGYLDATPVRVHEVSIDGDPEFLEFWVDYARAAHNAARCLDNVSVIQCHDWSTVLAGIATRRSFARPLVFNVHLPQRLPFNLALENLGLVAADLILVNSEAVRQELLERRLDTCRIEVVPNGVDSAEFRPASEWPANDGYIFFAGRLVPQKGVDTLLHAFAVLLRKADVQLVVAGDGPFELYLRRVALDLGVIDRVSFLNWQAGQTLVRGFQRAALVALPSLYEPFGIVALEAMACGRPVVASDTGGLRGIVHHGVDGYLVKPGDYLDFARRMLSLLSDQRRACSMGRAARINALSYSWESAAGRTNQLYHQVAYGGEQWVRSAQGHRTVSNVLEYVGPPYVEIARQLMGMTESR